MRQSNGGFRTTRNNATSSKSGSSWQRGQDSSQRSSPKPSGAHSTQDVATPHTAPVSPLHDQYASHGRKDRRRIPGISKTQRRIKASSTPALLDRDHESRQWSGDEESDEARSHQTRTEHPLTEATIPLVTHSRLQDPSTLNSSNVIASSGGGGGGGSGSGQNSHRSNTPQNQQESVLQKFRKSFSLRFHKKGSKESTEGECPMEENERTTGGQLGEEEERETSTILSSEQSSQHKDDPGNDQKFRFGPLVWRSSKERKKSNKAARNAKCNSGDSGIQIENARIRNRSRLNGKEL
ncbi:hypothetical protein M0802_011481 [Mischocyttarus mexicanus]|nr:hypothetical protein M0802_011481 [Mischocyttarus mexicanus]